jgi:glycosyltransferase involved in cell wall biosynthesis/peptidoglycan/xylan/chitin deacetylase (PgdA/CDA1 family)
MTISIIIPAYNAEETIAQTIESVLTQTYQKWEAIIVNDGSSDSTLSVVSKFVLQDSRIQVINLPNRGVSIARNVGISLAKHDWLLFLDADDWIGTEHLERMTNKLGKDESLDAVVCGWVAVASNGKMGEKKYASTHPDMFPLLACYPAFAIHTCIFRKSFISVVGEFNPALSVCEDWDLWQRIARAGAHFGILHETYAYYRLKSNSLSKNGEDFLSAALHVLEIGHSPDPRVKRSHPDYINGLTPELQPAIKIYWACWCAGILIAQEKDARSLLRFIKYDQRLTLDPYIIADNIFKSVCNAVGQLPAAWPSLWQQYEKGIHDFFLTLEANFQNTGLTRQSFALLERMVMQETEENESIIIGKVRIITLEITALIQDYHLPPTIERLYCRVQMQGKKLGTIELPVCDGMVSGWVLKDAIAAQFAWQILGAYFEKTVYKFGLSDNNKNATISSSEHHDQFGWETFIQQIWSNNSTLVNTATSTKALTGFNRIKKIFFRKKVSAAVIEVSDTLRDIMVESPFLQVIYRVGGITAGIVNVPTKDGKVSAHELQEAIMDAGGFEFCRICVREALVGRPLKETGSIKEQLAQAAKELSKVNKEVNSFDGLAGLGLSAVTANTVLLGHRFGGAGLSASRRAALPAAVANNILEMAQVTAEPILQVPAVGEQPDRVLYVPELLDFSKHSIGIPQIKQAAEKSAAVYGRHFFETLFSKNPDPWKYTHPYEQTKYEFTLSLLPPGQINNALELASAEGHFTAQLAPKVTNLIAADISKVALERTAERCKDFNHIRYQQLDIVKDELPGRFDLIVCSEVLYYVGGLTELQLVADKFAAALSLDGYLLMAHAHQIVDEPDKPGFDWQLQFGAKVIGDTFRSTPSLHLIKEIRTPLYRVQLFQNKQESDLSLKHAATPAIRLLEQPTPVPPAVEASVRWNGGTPTAPAIEQSITTRSLPILMYHRVAPTGSDSLTRYRVSPTMFEEQLKYLRDSGFYSASLHDWITAMLTRQPLPGRAIVITFDDGYSDFYQYAWPLLKKYGFTAIVFLVAELVGKTNAWDNRYEEELPLMDWEKVLELHKEGVTFGSHTASHSLLTSLSPTEIALEAARSRKIIQEALKVPIKIIAYPYGDTDSVVEHLSGACGYTVGLSCKPGLSNLTDNPLSLPRIEVKGSYSLQDFIANLSI